MPVPEHPITPAEDDHVLRELAARNEASATLAERIDALAQERLAVAVRREAERLTALRLAGAMGDAPSLLLFAAAEVEKGEIADSAALAAAIASYELATRNVAAAERGMLKVLARRYGVAISDEVGRAVALWLSLLESVFMLVPSCVRSRLEAAWAAEKAVATEATEPAILLRVIHTVLPVAEQNEYNAPPARFHTGEIDDDLMAFLLSVRELSGAFTQIEFGQRSKEPTPDASRPMGWVPGEQVYV